jgi:hypothetical protein
MATDVFDVETTCPEWAGRRRPGLHDLNTRRIELATAPAPDDPQEGEVYLPDLPKQAGPNREED